MSPRRPPLSRAPTEATVDGFTHGGDGVARVEGKAVFVAGTIPGERIRLRVVEDHKSWARADLLEVLDASPDRVVPPCPYVPECGGCDLQHVAPEAQRRLKTRVVTEQLERLGGLSDPPVAPTRAVGPDAAYRNNARFHAGPDGRLGFHRAGTHDVVAVGPCYILGEEAQALRDAVGDDTGAADVVVRAHGGDPDAVDGGAPDARDVRTGSRAVVIRPGEGGLTTPEGDFDLLLEQPDGATLPLRGDGVLAETVAGFTYRFDAGCFFQVNRAGAEAIVDEVLAAAGDLAGALVWDLYAGVGLLSLPLARAGAEVVAVEGYADAAGWAQENADAAGCDVTVAAQPVGDFVAAMAGPGSGGDAPDVVVLDAPDVVVLDPPRTGAGIDVCRQLAALAPATIVYVACDPAALSRDAKVLAEHGYRLRRAVPLDLFPMTHHVEVVATFTP